MKSANLLHQCGNDTWTSLSRRVMFNLGPVSPVTCCKISADTAETKQMSLRVRIADVTAENAKFAYQSTASEVASTGLAETMCFHQSHSTLSWRTHQWLRCPDRTDMSPIEHCEDKHLALHTHESSWRYQYFWLYCEIDGQVSLTPCSYSYHRLTGNKISVGELTGFWQG